MFDEASPGCPRRCQLPPLAKGDVDEEDEDVSDSESDYICEQVEEMSDRFHAGERLKPADFEFWLWELFVYWRRIERQFETAIQIKLGIVAGGFLK